MNILVFDIETVPDVEGGRRVLSLDESETGPLADQLVAEAMFAKRRQETKGSDFLRLHLHRIVAISAVLRTPDRVNVWSLGDENASEGEIIERFFAGVDRFTPTLVSWNGSGFDLPVLHYRAMLHKVSAPRYWEMGETDNQFKWNNYISRYHTRHLDVMDLVALYQARAYAPLDEMASLFGFPGKMGMSGAKVWDCFQEGGIQQIRDYCETDVLNTYLVYLRFQLHRGQVTLQQYDDEIQFLRDYLKQEDRPHFNEFLAAWKD